MRVGAFGFHYIFAFWQQCVAFLSLLVISVY